eukprot:3418536-Rhodomonas_salina.1
MFHCFFWCACCLLRDLVLPHACSIVFSSSLTNSSTCAASTAIDSPPQLPSVPFLSASAACHCKSDFQKPHSPNVLHQHQRDADVGLVLSLSQTWTHPRCLAPNTYPAPPSLLPLRSRTEARLSPHPKTGRGEERQAEEGEERKARGLPEMGRRALPRSGRRGRRVGGEVTSQSSRPGFKKQFRVYCLSTPSLARPTFPPPRSPPRPLVPPYAPSVPGSAYQGSMSVPAVAYTLVARA